MPSTCKAMCNNYTVPFSLKEWKLSSPKMRRELPPYLDSFSFYSLTPFCIGGSVRDSLLLFL